MSKFWWGIIGGILLSGWGSFMLLGADHYRYYIKEPLADALGVSGVFSDTSAQTPEETEEEGFDYSSFNKYKEVYSILDSQFIDTESIDFLEMHDNSLKGFVDALGDPYTSYLDVKENTSFDESIQGTQNFEGIGAVVTKKKDGVMIEEVLKGSPAFLAGIQALDLILKIGEESTQDLDLFEAVNLIRGPKESQVVLTIYRELEDEILELEVTRDTIDVPSVSGELLDIDGENILYLEIATFGEDTVIKMREVLGQYANIDGVILDLRGNGGGILPISVEVASFFVPKGELVSKIEYSTFEDEYQRSKGFGNLEGLPIVVLVDQMSASASEIVAGALHELVDATLIGMKTFGKGSVQTVFPLDDGSSLKLSIGRRHLPSGENIDKEGIEPDIEVEFDLEQFKEDSVDIQLERAKEEIALKLGVEFKSEYVIQPIEKELEDLEEEVQPDENEGKEGLEIDIPLEQDLENRLDEPLVEIEETVDDQVAE